MPLTCKLRTVKDLPGVGVVEARGGVDPISLEALEEAVNDTSRRGLRLVILDLAEIRYVNSAGQAYLVNVSDAMARRGGALLLANLQPKVKVVFDLMDVTRLLRIFKSVDAALGAVVVSRRKLRKQA